MIFSSENIDQPNILIEASFQFQPSSLLIRCFNFETKRLKQREKRELISDHARPIHFFSEQPCINITSILERPVHFHIGFQWKKRSGLLNWTKPRCSYWNKWTVDSIYFTILKYICQLDLTELSGSTRTLSIFYFHFSPTLPLPLFIQF